jgi:hypothetical protein
MNKYVWIGIAGVLAMFVLVMVVYCISTSNKEIRLRVTLSAKQLDNKSEFDNMWKKIQQVAQVTEEDRESLMRLFNEYANARTTKEGGSLSKWVQESVPNVDNSTFKNLQNIIVSSRDSWTARQKEIINLKAEHDYLRLQWPSSMVVGGRPEVEITIITSGRTERTFGTGKDDDVDVFKNK